MKSEGDQWRGERRKDRGWERDPAKAEGGKEGAAGEVSGRQVLP